jgi:hypothetical protein
MAPFVLAVPVPDPIGDVTIKFGQVLIAEGNCDLPVFAFKIAKSHPRLRLGQDPAAQNKRAGFDTGPMSYHKE